MVRAVQQARRDAGLEVSDRIALQLGGDESVRAAVEAHAELIKAETLASTLETLDLSESDSVSVGDGQKVSVASSRG